MSWREQIELELAKAQKGLQEENDGLARVCARRAITLGVQNWIERRGSTSQATDVLTSLRMVQDQESFPLEVTAAAQRLLIKVTSHTKSAISTDPISDARLILTYFYSHHSSRSTLL
ncbi:MAG: hypothetical protein ACPGYT_02820 [Nitrospirales bacterium]